MKEADICGQGEVYYDLGYYAECGEEFVRGGVALRVPVGWFVCGLS